VNIKGLYTIIMTLKH